MVAQAQIRDLAFARTGYAAPTIDLDSRKVWQEEWGLLVLLGAIGLGAIAYAGYCTHVGGHSSFSFRLTGVSASCRR